MAAKAFRLTGHPPQFVGPGSSGLFPVPNYQEAAGWQDPNPGELHSSVGGGHQEYHRRGVHTAFWWWYEWHEKCLVLGRIHQEILKNKLLKNLNRFVNKNYVCTLHTCTMQMSMCMYMSMFMYMSMCMNSTFTKTCAYVHVHEYI